MSDSEIINFFTNQTVFLTGGTGFLGKVLVEKILRVCEVKKLHLLVRPKKGKSVENRFDEYFNIPCFENIKKHRAIKEKLCFITGDCEETNLGITEENEKMLIEETNIVIHAAANVKFDQPLRLATKANIRSTMHILNLSKKMLQLKSFVYVSTAFSNCPHQTIEEKCYPPPITAKNLFSLLDIITDDALLAKMTPILLKEWPNTYTFTKSIAEDYINSERGELRVGIVRPSIVISTAEDPFPGWNDNFYGVAGITVAAALGVLRSFNAKPDCIANLVPCDFVSNSILAATWDAASDNSTHIKIYNYSATENNFVTWEQYMQIIKNLGNRVPPSRAVWYHTFQLRENKTWHRICVFFLHTILAYIADFVLICIGRQPLAIKNYNKLDKLMDLTTYFAKQNWTFVNNNISNLWRKLNTKDKQMFKFNMDSLDFVSFIENGVIGGRIYLLKDPLTTVPRALKRYQLLKIIHYASLAVLFFLLYKLIAFVLSCFI